MYLRFTSIFILITYISVFVLEPSIVLAQGSNQSQVTTSNSNSMNSFSSQASTVGLPVNISIDPARLSLSFSETITTIKSSALSKLFFPLSITNGVSGNRLNALFDDKALSFNIPYIQYLTKKDNKRFFDLFIGSKKHPFMIMTDQQGQNSVHFLYQILDEFKIEELPNNRIKFTDKAGMIYVFQQASEPHLSFLYRVYAIINHQGHTIQFQYTPNGDIDILNNAKDVVVRVIKMPGKVLVAYQTLMGSWQLFEITNKDAKTVTLKNPLNQIVELIYADRTSVTDINLPTGVNHHFDYVKLEHVSYIIDGVTERVRQNNSYIAKYTKRLNNAHSEDNVIHYEVSQDGHNFAGNGIRCSKATFENLLPLQDWMIQCGLEHLDGDYGYTTLSKMKIPVFNGAGSKLMEQVSSNAYNYLHLPTYSAVSVDGGINFFGAKDL